MSEAPTTVATICQTLNARITAGEFAVGGKLPSERALSEQFATTRITLQEALGQLEAQGVIYRRAARLVHLATASYLQPAAAQPFSRHGAAAGARRPYRGDRQHGSHARRAAGRPPGAAPGAEAYRIRRLRYIDGRAVLYCEHYLNPAYFPGILDEDLTQSLTALYAARYGIHYGRVRFDMLPTLLPQQAAAMLKVTYGSPALFITRVNRDQHDRVIDCDLEYWRYDALHIDVEAQ